jgi:HSP90 family molecular chaperone
MLTQKERIDQILKEISDLMGVPIQFHQAAEEDQGRVIPAYDVNAIISKMIALFVFSSVNVPSSFAPAYNRVHADVEWWKTQMETLPIIPPAAEG